jgi:hypothetical protein
MVADADNALEEVNSGLIAQGYYTGVVVLTDEAAIRSNWPRASLKRLSTHSVSRPVSRR